MFVARLKVLIAGAALFVASLAPASAQDFRLLMIEQVGCHVCETFNRTVAPAYEASPEAQIAPLIHADLRGPLPDGVVLASRPFVTPTFILLDANGNELSRLLGYPGDNFFWGYVNEMFETARRGLSG